MAVAKRRTEATVSARLITGKRRAILTQFRVSFLLFIPSALVTEGFGKSMPCAYALFALTDIGWESKEFCSGQN